jgi:hypothetical protein
MKRRAKNSKNSKSVKNRRGAEDEMLTKVTIIMPMKRRMIQRRAYGRSPRKNEME